MLSSLVAAFISGEAVGAARRARRAVLIYTFAAITILTGLGFLVGAAYAAAARRFGTIEAASSFGIVFIVIGFVAVGIHSLSGRTRKREAAGRRGADLATIASVAAVSLLPALLRAPSLLKGKAGLAGIIGPALAILAYGIYRENVKPEDEKPID
ncbi:hypothetical protein [Mesorhizobium sp. 1B3]|uniref:hypothetical protein n=1 Tax=Mesorhizobium sp. 1B3 TaxID=3243599 RepID=UPI003D995A5F